METIHQNSVKYDELTQNLWDVEDKQKAFEDVIYASVINQTDINSKPVYPNESVRSMAVRSRKVKEQPWVDLENLRNSLESERRAVGRTLEKLNNLFKVKTAMIKAITS